MKNKSIPTKSMIIVCADKESVAKHRKLMNSKYLKPDNPRIITLEKFHEEGLSPFSSFIQPAAECLEPLRDMCTEAQNALYSEWSRLDKLPQSQKKVLPALNKALIPMSGARIRELIAEEQERMDDELKTSKRKMPWPSLGRWMKIIFSRARA